jgi:hypothetical protein
MAVESVDTAKAPHVAPVVFRTEAGDSIIWLVDQEPAVGAEDAGTGEADGAGNEGMGPDERPRGGEL